MVEFTSLILKNDVTVAISHLEELRARGMGVETIYLELLAPAARRMGDLWSEDLCDFTEVTMGLYRLQQVLHELSPAFQQESDQREQGRRALLLPAPGEQHTFGLQIVAEFFRRSGWDVTLEHPPSQQALARIVRQQWFAVVGLSVSGERQIDALAAAIRAVRKASCNRGIGVLVGGPLIASRPDVVALVGADATATDGRQAVQQAQDLLDLLHQRC